MNHGDCMWLMNPIKRLIKSEVPASKCINVLMHYDDSTLIDKSNKLIKIIKISGINHIAYPNQMLDIFKTRRNHFLKSFSSDFAMYFWQLRRKTNSFPQGVFKQGYAHELNARYKAAIQDANLFVNEFYLALVTKQPEGILNEAIKLIHWFSHRIDKEAKRAYLKSRHAELEEAARHVLNAFSDYDARVLSVRESEGVLLSESLEFLSCLVNGDSHAVPVKIAPAGSLLPRMRLFINNKSGTIEMRAADGRSRYCAMLSIKGYPPSTAQAMLSEIDRLPFEYIITQSFRFYDNHYAKSRFRDQQSDMLQSRDESVIQAEQIDDAFEQTASGDVAYGKHHFTLACYADSLDELNKHVARIVAKFSDINITCVREDIGMECAFWAQFPGNFNYILRSADISTRNTAGLMSFHNLPLGKISGNHWGNAVTVFETEAHSPYYFNFHYRDVGNFLVFGSMGSGKTLLVGFLIAQSMKFRRKHVIFDKDRGLEGLVRALKGTYQTLKPGISTGFNPCQLEDIPENRAFLAALFKKMLTVNGGSFTEADSTVVNSAINGLYRMKDKASRQLCHLAPYFGHNKPGSLRARFDEWHSDGVHAWAFDNEADSFDFSPDVLGIDVGRILNSKECKVPLLMYLLHRVEQSFAGVGGMIFIDEGWVAIDDDYFKGFLNDGSRTFRKKNIILGLATQVANDTAKSAISKALNESSFCKFFFPNPTADRDVHINELGLSEHQYELVKTLPDNEHKFILVHGQGVNQETVVARVNLEKMPDVIPIISGREETVLILDRVRNEVGDDPDEFLPLFTSEVQRQGVRV